jgi:hypothetical protein
MFEEVRTRKNQCILLWCQAVPTLPDLRNGDARGCTASNHRNHTGEPGARAFIAGESSNT